MSWIRSVCLIVVCAAGAAMLSAVNQQYWKTTTEAQVSYDSWIQNMQHKLFTNQTDALTHFQISIASPTLAYDLDWNYDSNQESLSRDSALRLLNQIGAARVFEHSIDTAAKSDLDILVSSDELKYQAHLTSEQIRKNIALQNLIKLIEVLNKPSTVQNPQIDTANNLKGKRLDENS